MFGWLSKKEYKLTVEGHESFTLANKETVLNGALRNGIDFPYSCKVGGCAACKCQLVSGKVKELTDKSYLLSKEDIQQNYILGCQSIPVSDVVVRLPENPLANQNTTGTLIRQDMLTHDIAEITIKLEAPIRYIGGQYASLKASGTDIPARAYSFAHKCGPDGNSEIAFFVRLVPNGRMSHWLLSPQALNQKVEVKAALGEFHLRPGKESLICVAGGSGLAPLIALLESAIGSDAVNRNVFLLMGARTQRDLYYVEQIEALKKQWRGRFEFIPVLSEEPADSNWTGMRGWVTDAITPQISKDAQGYLCGPPPMIDAAIAKMTEQGINRSQIYFDKFSDQSSAGV
ncbi:MAG TPA: 2Fe-2S iron-sulfur cluster binding domain-containing protein [Pseudomonadales bacterium]|nr:2Fe-2S iron-sulfur cluster binding domain-containing protein [Pseudomonadales bacterium]